MNVPIKAKSVTGDPGFVILGSVQREGSGGQGTIEGLLLPHLWFVCHLRNERYGTGGDKEGEEKLLWKVPLLK